MTYAHQHAHALRAKKSREHTSERAKACEWLESGASRASREKIPIGYGCVRPARRGTRPRPRGERSGRGNAGGGFEHGRVYQRAAHAIGSANVF